MSRPLLFVLCVLPTLVLGQTLDPSFGTAGLALVDFAADNDDAQELAILPDGRIYVAGYATVSGALMPAITRLLASGSPDPLFGTNGRVTISLSDAGAGQAMAVQQDGKVLIAGNRLVGVSADLFAARLLTNGDPDPTFGTNGIAELVTSSIGATFWDMAVQADGRIVVTGSTLDGTNNEILTVRLLTDGSLDAGFGINGVVTTAAGPYNDGSLALAIQPDGKILVAGYSNLPGQQALVVARLLATGLPDNGFGTNGILLLNISNDEDEAADIEVQSDGRIVIAGSTRPSFDTDLLVVRLLDDGTPDPAFGNAGIVLFDEPDFQEVDRVAIDSEGGLVLTCTVDGTFEDIRVLRLLADGSADPAYDATFNIFNDDNSSAIGIQGDGKVVVAGENRDGEVLGDMLVMRLSAPGATSVNGLLQENAQLMIAPNPVDRYFKITNGGVGSNALITVCDMTGRMVPVTSAFQSDGLIVDASGLASGTYSITVWTVGGKAMARFVKE